MSKRAGKRMQQDGFAESSPGLWWDVTKSAAECSETVSAVAPATLKSVCCQSVLELAGVTVFPWDMPLRPPRLSEKIEVPSHFRSL